MRRAGVQPDALAHDAVFGIAAPVAFAEGQIAAQFSCGRLREAEGIIRTAERQKSRAAAAEAFLQPGTDSGCDAVFLDLRVSVMKDTHAARAGVIQRTEEWVEHADVAVREMQACGIALEVLVEATLLGVAYGCHPLPDQLLGVRCGLRGLVRDK